MSALPAALLALLAVAGSCSDCLLPRDRGDRSCGQAGGLRFHFDTRTKHCQPFMFEGCAGNGNRFGTAAECREKCAGVNADDASAASNHGMVLQVPKCAGGVRAAVNNNSVPLSCADCPENHTCQKDLCCADQKAACDVQYDTGKYAFQGSHTPRYFFDKSVNNCLIFTYYGALGNANNFETYNECMRFCHKE